MFRSIGTELPKNDCHIVNKIIYKTEFYPTPTFVLQLQKKRKKG